jgi:hypothetical protein
MEPVANVNLLAALPSVIGSAPGSERTGGLSETDTRQG